MTGIGTLVQVLSKVQFFGILALYTKEKVWPGGMPPVLFPQSSCVCIQRFRSVTPRVCLVKVPFSAFLALHEHRTGSGLIDMLKTFPGNMIPNMCSWV